MPPRKIDHTIRRSSSTTRPPYRTALRGNGTIDRAALERAAGILLRAGR